MDNLKNLRNKTHLSQTELATRAGVPRWKLSMAENGRRLENGRCPLRPEEQAAVLEVLQAQFRGIVEDAQAFGLDGDTSRPWSLQLLDCDHCTPRSRQRGLTAQIDG
jgi:transcriptional regulator with XRE-family HTH domain